MHPTDLTQTSVPATLRSPSSVLRFALGRRGDLTLSTSATADSGSDFRFQVSVLSPPRKRSAFTLIELLVVIAIIAILAGLGFPAISGAIMSGKKGEVRSTANQIKLALSSYYAEYGTYPNVTNANPQFLRAMTGATNEPTVPNRRGIRFLELTDKWTNSDGIVTPERFLPTRTVFNIAVDTNYDGRLDFDPGTGRTNIGGSIAVYVPDPTQTNKVIGTW